MDGLRIAMFSDSALPILNGVSVSLSGLIGELRNAGHSVHLFTARYPGFKDPDPNTYRFRAIETPISKGYPVSYPPFYRMLRVFRRQEYDIIHTHTPFVLGMVGLRWAEAHQVPIVSTYHTLYDRYSHYIPILPRRYVRFRIAKHTNFYYNQVAHVITPTEASYRWLHRHSVSTPVSIVPTGIIQGPKHPRAETRNALGLAPELKVLLYVGRLAKEKNLETIFEASAIAFRKDSSLRLLLVGDGPYRNECRTMVRRLNIGDRVKFLGFLPHTEVERYYAAADLFVFASTTETQGLVVQEAMMYGLPAIVVAGGGAEDAVTDGANGHVVKNDPEAFAQSVLELLMDESVYSAMSTHAQKSARMHGMGEMAKQVVSLYRNVIEQERETAHYTNFACI